MQLLTCVRCGHVWGSRKATRPERCAKCVAKYWWRPARIAQIKPEKRPMGRPNKYHVHILNVGQEIIIPVEIGASTISAKQCVQQYGVRHGRRFTVARVVAGLKVRRVL